MRIFAGITPSGGVKVKHPLSLVTKYTNYKHDGRAVLFTVAELLFYV